MPKYTFPREFYIRKGWLKVAAKGCDAVAYITPRGVTPVCAMVFAGKCVKPIWHYQFKNEEQRAARVAEFFQQQVALVAYKTERKAAEAEARAKGHGLEVGHVLYTSWGYDQTNIDWYEVVEVVGPCTVKVAPIAATEVEQTGWLQGKVVPVTGKFTGKPMTVRAVNGKYGVTIKIEGHYGHLWKGQPVQYTAYA